MYSVFFINCIHIITIKCTHLEHPRALFMIKQAITQFLIYTNFLKTQSMVLLLLRQDQILWSVHFQHHY